MKLQLTRIFAVLVSVLAILGLFTNGHLFEVMNADPVLDVLRLGLAAYLIYAGFISKSESSLSTALLLTGVLYLGLGVIGLISPTVGGLLPAGLTGFDVAFHLATGLLAMVGAMQNHGRMASNS